MRPACVIPPPAPSEPIWAARKAPPRPSAPPLAPSRTLFLTAPSTFLAAPEPGRTAAAPDAKSIALRAKIQLLATQCHLSSAVGEAIADEWVGTAPTLAATDFISSLRTSLKRRASSTIDLDRAATSLEWFADFISASSRRPFVPLAHAGDIQAAIYNSETLELFGEYMRARGSRQRGRVGTAITSDTVDTYVGTVKILASLGAHHGITFDSANVVMPRASKANRRAQAPPGERKLKRGIRAHHLRALVALGFDRSSARGIIEWAAGLVAWNILLRGCELGVVPGKPLDTARDAVFGAITWRSPCHDSAGLPWLVWDVVPAKDTTARRRSCPMAIRRRSAVPLGADPLCTYDAIFIAWTATAGAHPPESGRTLDPSLAIRPFFIGRDGGPWDTEDTRLLARRFATALGLDPSEFGGKSFRIGGATDWRDIFGADAERVIKQRGRWQSDIAFLYQRALAETHLRGSAAVADADHADLESLCLGWAQPANFR